jgi:hypothetical protein
MDYTFMAAIFGVSVLNLLLLGYLHERMRRIEAMIRENTPKIDEDQDNPYSGMNLMLLRPKPKAQKSRRFTDKARNWITAHETASRR